ncbi:hypothetical protein [uncultured Clostridium sp.]|uniref:hypothetical protein n=1 Tax=uncultured Clostridium sp. TaxID=59620 RepID=UPI0025E04A4E|nr:hypothetical protein [uncultured Clostridium sp.]
MAKFKGKFLCIIAFSVFSLFLLGCDSKEDASQVNSAENVNVNSGAVLKSEDGDYAVYDYRDKYVKSETDKLVLTYDKSSSSYIYRDENETFAVHGNKEFNIGVSDYYKLKISPGGNYISYFINDNGMKLKVINLNDNNEVQIESNVSISGTLFDWYNDNCIVYYGVSNEGVNGLFTYNIDDKKEELLYKLKEGYIAFLKGNVDNVLFLQLNFNNDRQLVILDKDTKDAKVINDNIEEIKDAVCVDNDIYFVGKVKDNAESLYKISNGSTKRVAYDFPALIDIEKGIEKDSNDDVLFIGRNNLNSSKEQVYKYSADGSISSISDEASDYAFLEYISFN